MTEEILYFDRSKCVVSARKTGCAALCMISDES